MIRTNRAYFIFFIFFKDFPNITMQGHNCNVSAPSCVKTTMQQQDDTKLYIKIRH